MGKDIDRNITRQLWERLKNTFTRNDVIPVKNGGTGVSDLKKFYPKLVEDKNVTTIEVKNLTTVEGFTINSDTTLFIKINEKSMYLEGTIHVTRSPNITTNLYLKHTIPVTGYNINEVQFGPYGSKFSLVDNILSLMGDFSTNNEYRAQPQIFVPFI